MPLRHPVVGLISDLIVQRSRSQGSKVPECLPLPIASSHCIDIRQVGGPYVVTHAPLFLLDFVVFTHLLFTEHCHEVDARDIAVSDCMFIFVC